MKCTQSLDHFQDFRYTLELDANADNCPRPEMSFLGGLIKSVATLRRIIYVSQGRSLRMALAFFGGFLLRNASAALSAASSAAARYGNVESRGGG